ncbi:MAG: hypothetical protein ACPL7I_04690 [Myxococcota bacterium]
MKFKVLLIVFTVFAISLFTFAISSCGDSEGAKIDCSKVCAKGKECEKDWTEDDVKKCETGCNNINEKGYLQDPAVNAINSCYKKDDCSELQNCLDNSKPSCKTADYMPYINAVCDKQISCGTQVTKEKCVEDQKKNIEEQEAKEPSCFTDKFYSDFGECIKKVSCENMENDIIKCMTDMFGIELK